MEIGRQIQAGFLPQSLPRLDGWELAALFRPAHKVAGDFYDAFELGGQDSPVPGRNLLALVIADVCD